MLRCPTSELPICPSGSPTASPAHSIGAQGLVANSASSTGVSAKATALPSRFDSP